MVTTRILGVELMIDGLKIGPILEYHVQLQRIEPPQVTVVLLGHVFLADFRMGPCFFHAGAHDFTGVLTSISINCHGVAKSELLIKNIGIDVPMSDSLKAWVQALHISPSDKALRLVASDWCEENGHAKMAAALRREAG